MGMWAIVPLNAEAVSAAAALVHPAAKSSSAFSTSYAQVLIALFTEALVVYLNLIIVL